MIDKALGISDPAEIQQRIDELTAELERVQQRITHVTEQGQDVVARLQQLRDSLAESRSLRSRYEELAASYRARIARFDSVEEGHALEQDDGQMIISGNTKFMPDIEPLKNRYKLIIYSKREGEGRCGFLLDAQDKDLIDLEETDDN